MAWLYITHNINIHNFDEALAFDYKLNDFFFDTHFSSTYHSKFCFSFNEATDIFI